MDRKKYVPGSDTVFVDETNWPKPRWSNPGFLRDEFARYEADRAVDQQSESEDN